MFLNKIVIFLSSIVLLGCSTTPLTTNKEVSNTEVIVKPIIIETIVASESNKPVDVSAPLASLKRAYKSAKVNPILHTETIITRSTIQSNVSLPEISYSFIYLNSKPTTKAKYDKYISVCETWLSVFNTKEEVKDYIRNDQTIEFHNLNWLLKKPIDNINNCKEYVDNYDYGRATILARSLKANTNKIQIITKIKNKTLAIDINKVIEEDIEKVMYVWKDTICKPTIEIKTIKPNTIFDSFKMALAALGSVVQFKISVN